MGKPRFNEDQILPILKEREEGRSIADICREHRISSATFYAWRSKIAGLRVGEAQRLRQIEDENRRLKQLVADLSLDREALRAVIRKNGGVTAGLMNARG
jgi:putative transposase